MKELALISLSVTAMFELSLYALWSWRIRLVLTRLALALVVASSLFFVVIDVNAASVLLAVLSLYRLINLRRLLRQCIQPDYLYNSGRQTSLLLITAQASLLGLGFTRWPPHDWLILLAGGQMAVAVLLLMTTARHLRTTKPPVISKHLIEAELPSLTVAIPARNESDDLRACLDSLISSNYPKLEIVVLDDSSQDRRTPEIIRSFAQAGVRFIPGDTPPEHWLAKNFAYKKLSDSANGELILFCGVDARFQPGSLRHLVETLLAKRKSMLCVLPRNLVPASRLHANLIQPARYAWELALPRRLLVRPPVLSTCWLISAQMLRQAGGFDAVSRKIIPESYFARQAVNRNDSYSFVRAENELAVTSSKSFAEQKLTAIRTRYPQLHRRPELVALTSLAELFVLSWPLISLLAGLLTRDMAVGALGLAGYLMTAVLEVLVVSLTYRKLMPEAAVFLPLAALYDIWILNYSMWRYEFGTVYWKGRDITRPVMRRVSASAKPI